jgi:hypothetical protein
LTGLIGRLPRAAIALIAVHGLAGCVSIPARVAEYDAPRPGLEIESAPFYPQARYQCGPAALLTALSHSGVSASLDAVTSLTYIPGRQGSLQTELLATARHYDRLPYRIDGTMSALVAELAAGRPVLVLQNLGVNWYPRWHYAVVVGIDAATDQVILRSGTERRRLTPVRTFLRTWQRGERWGVVMLKPGEMPAEPDRATYSQAVADLEATGHFRAALAAWSAALGRWPGDPAALFGKANAALRLQQYSIAESTYRTILERQPDMHAARNNLAYALAGQGRLREALGEIGTVLDRVGPDDPLRAEYESSARELASRAGVPDPG